MKGREMSRLMSFKFARRSPEPPRSTTATTVTTTTTTTTTITTITATIMHLAIDIGIVLAVSLSVVFLLGLTVKSKWDWSSAMQFGIPVCLVGLNIVLFVHHSTPLVDQIMTADLAFLVNGTFFQVVFWISECWNFESRSWSYWTLAVGFVNDTMAIANTACAVKKSGWTSGNKFALSLGCVNLSLPIFSLVYELFRSEAWPRIMSLRADKKKKKHARKPSTGSP